MPLQPGSARHCSGGASPGADFRATDAASYGGRQPPGKRPSMPDQRPDHDQTDTTRIDPAPVSMAPASMAAPAAPKDFPVVAIGASAGGLDACRKFLDSLPVSTGMAFILIQHL